MMSDRWWPARKDTKPKKEKFDIKSRNPLENPSNLPPDKQTERTLNLR